MGLLRLLTDAVISGTVGGTQAAIKGLNIWTGAPKAPGTSAWEIPKRNIAELKKAGYFKKANGTWERTSVDLGDGIAEFPSGNSYTIDSGGGAGTQKITKVGRWMSMAEYNTISSNGRLVIGAGGKTSVSTGGPNSFRGAPKGSVYVEFEVPTNSLVQGGQSDWYSILGPDALKSQLFILQKQGGQIFPQIQNLSPIIQIK